VTAEDFALAIDEFQTDSVPEISNYNKERKGADAMKQYLRT
jgi:hypothetical protein